MPVARPFVAVGSPDRIIVPFVLEIVPFNIVTLVTVTGPVKLLVPELETVPLTVLPPVNVLAPVTARVPATVALFVIATVAPLPMLSPPVNSRFVADAWGRLP